MSGGMGGGAGGGAGGAEQTIQVNVSIYILFIDAYFDVDIYLVETGHNWGYHETILEIW